MRVVYDHSFGLQSQAEVYHCSMTLEHVRWGEFDQILQEGWLATAKEGRPHWYQCRSTRCVLAEINYTTLDTAEILDPLPESEIDHIYSAYCYHKKYRKYFEVGERLRPGEHPEREPWDLFMGYRDAGGSLIAWSKLRHYTIHSVETTLFAWDYRDPDLHLGSRSLEHELAWAKAQDYTYVYMGPGYERMNRYKADVVGFEWWTGREWSRDLDQYRWLCDRDSKIKSCVDLHDLQTKP
jgi:hypothetical protein